MNEKIHMNGAVIDLLERKLLEILKNKEEKRSIKY
jgi:flagellar biosynthesis regulator FlbT